MKRTILAGLLAGLALFAWEFIAHTLLPLGESGVKALPNEEEVVGALKDNIRDAGFYFFPAPEDRPGMTPQQKQDAMAAVQEHWRTGPAGIIIFHPNGTGATFARQLLTQFGFDLAAMLLAAVVLSQSATRDYLKRVLLITTLGLFPIVRTEIPNWNWLGFPAAYMLAQVTVHLAGFLLGGLVLAKVVRPGERQQDPDERAAIAA
jgi:hypothetical protein